jgi:eukaryotic-like serine/threonine-protein kinase
LGREIGAVIGEHRLLAVIGSGAAGEVFKAEHVITHRLEAVKFLAHGRPVLPEEEGSFLREIELQAALQHPNIAAVHNACRTPEGLALVMELVDGEPLSAILGRGRVPLPDGIRYVLQTLDALGYAHGRGIVHGDVKPANIMVGPDGTVKLTDFGLAHPLAGPQLTSAGAPAGSPYYMSPEQVTGKAPFDARSDYYSLGVVLYELVTGRRPFDGESAFDVMLQQCERPPAPPVLMAPGISLQLNRVILTAMEKDPARRFQYAVEFRRALEEAAGDQPLRKSSTARRWLIAGATALLGGAAVLFASLHRPPVSATARVAEQTPAPVAKKAAVLETVAPPIPAPPFETPVEPAPKKRARVTAARQHRVETQIAADAPPGSEAATALPDVREELVPNAPADPPAASATAERAPEVEPSRPVRPLSDEAAAETNTKQPAKRRNVVWRALGHIIHPRQ